MYVIVINISTWVYAVQYFLCELRLITCLENQLEMLGNRQKVAGKLGKILSGKLFIAGFKFGTISVFSRLLWSRSMYEIGRYAGCKNYSFD